MKSTALWGALISTVLATLAVLAPATPAQAEAGDPATTVTYPEPTSFNPDAVTYTVHIESTEPGELRLQDIYEHIQRPVDDAGNVTLTFPKDGRHVLQVLRCVPDTPCVASNPRTVYTYRDFAADVPYVVYAGPRQAPDATYSVEPADVPATLTWSVETDDTVVVSGSEDVVTGADAHLRFAMPPGTPDGRYVLHWSLSSDSASYGHLETALRKVPLQWRSEAKPVELTVSADVIYPAQDGYLDRVKIRGVGNGEVLEAAVVAADGRVVATFADSDELRRGFVWTGMVDRRPVPPGQYHVTLTGRDPSGNIATAKPRRLVVHGEKLRSTTVTQTMKAASTVVSTSVGRCSTLASPARGRGPGSLGYYSQTRCDRDDDSGVTTVNAMALPTSYNGRYTHVAVTIRGGAARGTRRAYAVLLYWNGHEYDNRRQFNGAFGDHAGRTLISATSRVVKRHGTPYLFFLIGLTAGSRYDVASITLRATTTQLR